MKCEVCLFCGRCEGFVFVHGHYPCVRFNYVQVRRCEGETAQSIPRGSKTF
jgi:hypothetical protein